MTTEYPPSPSAPYSAPPVPAPAKGSNGLAVAGFVLGLLGFLGSWIPVLNIVGLVLGVIGVILAAIGLAKAKRAGAGKGLAITGLVLGGLAVVIAIVVNVAFVNAVDDAVDKATDTKVDTPAGSKDGGSDGEAGTTRDNPAPVGSSITGGDWTVTINSVKSVQSDSLGQKPAAGSTLLVVNLTATYNGDEDQGQTPWASVKYVAADGTSFDSTGGSTLFLANKEFDSIKTVYKNGQVTGDQMIEIPDDGWQSGVLAVSPDLMSDDTFLAVK